MTQTHIHTQILHPRNVWEEGCNRVDKGGRFGEIKKRREEKRKEGREKQVGGEMTHC